MTNTTKTATASAEPAGCGNWRAVDTALWCYLFLPVPIFLVGFFIPALGLPLTAIAVAAAVHFIPRRRLSAESVRRPWPDWMLLALLAAAWAMLGGAGHVFHANGIDWVPRFAVLRDLVVEPWPPRYGGGHDVQLLRAPLAYYLPPALLAHASRLALADALLLAWTWLGLALFFCATFTGSRQVKLAAAVIFACASGLDVVGLWLRTGSLPWPTQHIEWWAAGLQYSSNSTLLFWVPNHGLPGWIAAGWLWRFRNDPAFLARLPTLFLPLMLWSPLVAIGLLPLASAAAAKHWRALRLSAPTLLTSLGLLALPAGLLAAYLLQGMFGGGAAEPTALTPTAPILMQPIGFGAKLLFVLLEAGIFCIFLIRRERSPLTLATTATLLVLPWLQFGPNNDLLMRASIPALCILWLAIAEELSTPENPQGQARGWRIALLILVVLGAVTPLQEIHRALAGHSWKADTRITAPQALDGFPPHYFVSERRAWLSSVLRR
jgi:hypothetical protein